MATDGARDTFDLTCTPCYKDGKHVSAFVYCEDCRECFCEQCYSFHQRFPATVVHKVVDGTAMRVGGAANMTSLPKDTCDTHDGKLIVVYCKDHDALCCGECVSGDHRSCSTIYIPAASIGFSDSSQLKDRVVSTKTLTCDIGEKKAERNSELQQLQTDKQTIITQIQTVTKDLIDKVKELEEKSIDMTMKSYKPEEAKVEAEIKYFECIESDTQSVLDDLAPNVTSDAQLFINEIRAKKHNKDTSKTLRDKSPKEFNNDEIVEFKYSTINQVLEQLNELESLVERSKINSTSFQGDYNVRLECDTSLCDIVGTCQLPDGTFVATDWSNNRLKRLDNTYSVTDHCNLSGSPWGVTCTSREEVAVTLIGRKKIQFVSLKQPMTTTRSFPTVDSGRGICYSRGHLYVACKGDRPRKGLKEGLGNVAVYSVDGQHKRIIETDLVGQNMFTYPYHITASCDGAKIYVAQKVGGVVILDRDGTHVGSISDPSLRQAHGLCTLDNGHILVCGHASNNVLQFNAKGKKHAELIRKTDGIEKAQSVCFDSHSTRIIVTLEKTDKIKVFDVV